MIHDDHQLTLNVLRELMVAEAEYRSAMNIYKDHPNHRTRIRAECNWHWAKSNAKTVLQNAGMALMDKR